MKSDNDTDTGTEMRHDVLRLMCDIPDPEIPVVNIVELGIVRGFESAPEVGPESEPNKAPSGHIIITPTYVGCPATDMISDMIREKLDAHGYSNIGIKNQLSPAWTTDWITKEAHEKLRNYGIDPPQKLGSSQLATCPRCGSQNTKLISEFSSTPCKALHSCIDCLEPFDRFKCH